MPTEESTVLRVERIADSPKEGLECAPFGRSELRRLGLEGGSDVDRIISDQGGLAQQHLAAGRTGNGRDDALAVVDLQAGDIRPDEQATQAHPRGCRLAVTDVDADAPLAHRGGSPSPG